MPGVYAQGIERIMGTLHNVNDSVTRVSCENGYGPVLTNRAVNMVLYEKTGTYLSTLTDFSLRKNTFVYNSGTGEAAIGHSFFQASGKDQLVRSFFVGGISAVIRSSASDHLLHAASGDLAVMAKQTWVGKTKITGNCGNTGTSQRRLMDATRSTILHSVETRYRREADEFEAQLSTSDSDSLKDALRKTFYGTLEYAFNRDFAEGQTQALMETNYYRRISTHWTSLSAGIPLIRQSYYVAENYSSSFNGLHSYPVSLRLSHTRFCETPGAGRFFVTVGGSSYLSNSYMSNGLMRTTYADYKAHGGKDTLSFASRTGGAYIGSFRRFVAIEANFKMVYFPSDSHVGVSIAAMQSFFRYSALTMRLGIPVVLIDKAGAPAINFEFQVNYYDVTGNVLPLVTARDKIVIGLTVGVPVSRVMF